MFNTISFYCSAFRETMNDRFSTISLFNFLIQNSGFSTIPLSTYSTNNLARLLILSIRSNLLQFYVTVVLRTMLTLTIRISFIFQFDFCFGVISSLSVSRDVFVCLNASVGPRINHLRNKLLYFPILFSSAWNPKDSEYEVLVSPCSCYRHSRLFLPRLESLSSRAGSLNSYSS